MSAVAAYVTDLIFRTKIASTAGALGVPIEIAGSVESLKAGLNEHRPALLLIDLDAAGNPVDAIRAARESTAPPRIVGFVSHVAADRIAAAQAAGADEVLARSAFVQRLPSLLEQARTAATCPTAASGDAPTPSNCPRCGAATLERRHCKLLCESCGYVESCEDLF